jgi:hypothetical protein
VKRPDQASTEWLNLLKPLNALCPLKCQCFFIRRQNKQLMLSFATVPHLLQITALSVGRRRQTNSLNQMIAEENLSSIIQRMKNNTV